jgi:hypothetical protein
MVKVYPLFPIPSLFNQTRRSVIQTHRTLLCSRKIFMPAPAEIPHPTYQPSRPKTRSKTHKESQPGQLSQPDKQATQASQVNEVSKASRVSKVVKANQANDASPQRYSIPPWNFLIQFHRRRTRQIGKCTYKESTNIDIHQYHHASLSIRTLLILPHPICQHQQPIGIRPRNQHTICLHRTALSKK